MIKSDFIMSEDAIIFHNDNAEIFHSRYETSKVFIERYQVWLKFLKQYIATDSKVLDLGCGPGVFSFFLNEYCSEVIGIDGAEKMIDLCDAKKSSCESEKVNFYQEKLPMAIIPQSYMNCDAIISSSVLEYIEELEGVIIQVNLMLKSDGLFIFSMPNAEGFYRKLEKIAFQCFSYPKYYRAVKNIISLQNLNTVMIHLGFSYVASGFYGSMLPNIVRNLLPNNRSCDLYIAVYRKITDVNDVI